MPALSCAATSCIYNEEEYCSRGDIRVGGERAKDVRDTCCESFVEREGDSAKNSVGSGCRTIDIDCEAYSCVYNEDSKCDAIQVDIAGGSACSIDQTACGTFREEE